MQCLQQTLCTVLHHTLDSLKNKMKHRKIREEMYQPQKKKKKKESCERNQKNNSRHRDLRIVNLKQYIMIYEFTIDDTERFQRARPNI